MNAADKSRNLKSGKVQVKPLDVENVCAPTHLEQKRRDGLVGKKGKNIAYYISRNGMVGAQEMLKGLRITLKWKRR